MRRGQAAHCASKSKVPDILSKVAELSAKTLSLAQQRRCAPAGRPSQTRSSGHRRRLPSVLTCECTSWCVLGHYVTTCAATSLPACKVVSDCKPGQHQHASTSCLPQAAQMQQQPKVSVLDRASGQLCPAAALTCCDDAMVYPRQRVRVRPRAVTDKSCKSDSVLPDYCNCQGE
jgi:hypothetical protein